MDNRDFGTVTYKGLEYEVTCDAWVDNDCINGDVVYYANAERDGKKYRVMWYTTKEFDLSGEIFNLEERLSHLESHIKNTGYTQESELMEIERLKDDIKELESQGANSEYCQHSENACDWDNADSMEEIND